jgi:hypothetical protein
MSFNSEDSTKIDKNIKIEYNYSNTIINPNQILHTLNSDGYVQASFLSNGPANVTINKKQWQSKNLYIIGSHHLIKDLSYNAELVIEHSPMTNDTSSKLYTCFLLKSDSSISKSDIDKLIVLDNIKSAIPISLDTKSKQIYYTDSAKNDVIIFTSPIKIHSDISNINTVMNLFSKNISEYHILPAVSENFTNSIEPFSLIEGLTQTAYCQPIDMIDPSGATDANLTIPLSGMYTPNDATNNVIRTSINFMTFVLVLGFTYAMSPVIYNDYVIGLIGATKLGQEKMNRIRSIDIYICLVFVLSVFSLILQGIRNNNSASTVIGFLVGIFFVISFVIIQTKKMDPIWFKRVFGDGMKSETLYNNISILDDFFAFLYENFMVFFKNILIGAVVFFILSMFFYMLGAFSTGGVLKSGDFIIYLSLFTIYLTIAITTIRNGAE